MQQNEEFAHTLLGIWRKFTKLKGPLDRLQTREFRGVVEQLQQIETHGITTRDHVAAYFLYHFFIHYQEALSILPEMAKKPGNVLDICSGASPFGLAACQLGATSLTIIDQNTEMLRLAAEVIGREGYPVSCLPWNFFKDRLPEGPFDTIIISHALFELFPEETEKLYTFIDYCYKRLQPDGAFIIVAGSSKEENTRFLRLREKLVLEKKIPVQAPCIARKECPALKNKAPCFTQRPFEKPHFIKELQRGIGVFQQSLRMSYMILRHPQASWPKVPDAIYRIISPPFEQNATTRYYVCGNDDCSYLSIKTAKIKDHPAIQYAQKGEVVLVKNGYEAGEAIEITHKTAVSSYAPLGKNLPERG